MDTKQIKTETSAPKRSYLDAFKEDAAAKAQMRYYEALELNLGQRIGELEQERHVAQNAALAHIERTKQETQRMAQERRQWLIERDTLMMQLRKSQTEHEQEVSGLRQARDNACEASAKLESRLTAQNKELDSAQKQYATFYKQNATSLKTAQDELAACKKLCEELKDENKDEIIATKGQQIEAYRLQVAKLTAQLVQQQAQHAAELKKIKDRHELEMKRLELNREIKVEFQCIDRSIRWRNKGLVVLRSAKFAELVEMLLKGLETKPSELEFTLNGNVIHNHNSNLVQLGINNKDKIGCASKHKGKKTVSSKKD